MEGEALAECGIWVPRWEDEMISLYRGTCRPPHQPPCPSRVAKPQEPGSSFACMWDRQQIFTKYVSSTGQLWSLESCLLGLRNFPLPLHVVQWQGIEWSSVVWSCGSEIWCNMCYSKECDTQRSPTVYTSNHIALPCGYYIFAKSSLPKWGAS